MRVDEKLQRPAAISAGDTSTLELEPDRAWPDPDVRQDVETAFCRATAASARWLADVIVTSAFATIRRPCPPGASRTERMRSRTLTGTPVRRSTQNVWMAWNARFATTLREGPRSPSSDAG